MYIDIYTYICIYIYIHVCIYIYVYIYIYIDIHVYTNIHSLKESKIWREVAGQQKKQRHLLLQLQREYSVTKRGAPCEC